MSEGIFSYAFHALNEAVVASLPPRTSVPAHSG
jgi:hypothetical protein